ncbi:UDP-N-acetylglucosamine 2-epimerase [Acidipropionibacterium acidipropionici ATCC 4875]|uniref:UDP-N-acetylglucosamine 2-epimerase n=1 Tax=Acidipropionibacterium acidipropionici (strain ATCC 4875 / DSM 20272 / JCM 6432 / NBRC 12425 / NCIMB 8070 / 4) TaxID=1171373 RepID=K7RKA3_ACIA4|nr:UDP-N-acetylglucosamine 2-epimerase (non-hydrolyzing) [Acidipropionibacterium acidipropionici]AFV88329.1 UDP-N-acetylglucosamine 2-epimerase [Acidipropionibacterium acidipropionici ATCC 4875]MDN6555058.1 UDP-N-acetylglucosamine 2-epimerase (non-hydrolyzing) [Acidipropionibacterium acidipropionici]
MRVVSIVGARPQFVKLAPVAKAFAAAGIDHRIIHTGQHYDVNMSDSFFVELGIPDPDLHLGVGGGSHGVMTGRMLEQLDPVLEDMAPDWVLVYGDTNSTIAGTLSAVKMHLRVAHLEAGLRSFNRRMPEEHNRVLTDHAADLCMAPTQVAMQHLADEGLADRSVLVGDVMTDVCLQVRDSVLATPRPVPGVAEGEPYVMATIHRADNTDQQARLEHILDALGGLDRKVILPVHPRLRARAKTDGIRIARGNLVTIDPLAYPDMVNAVVHADGVITDSGGLQKEAFLLGTVCTTVRTETEWTETVDNGWNVLDPGAEHLHETAVRPAPQGDPGHPYGDGHAAAKVAEVLERAEQVEEN